MPEMNVTSPSAAFARQARMEVRVERALMGVTRAFLADVEAMALAEGTYLSPAVVAARWAALTSPDALLARSLPAPVAAYVSASLAESSAPDDAYGTAMAVLTASNEGAWSATLTSDVLHEALSMDTPPQTLTAAAPRRDSKRGKEMQAAFDKALSGSGRISWSAAVKRDARTAVTGLAGIVDGAEMRNQGIPSKQWVTRRDERVRHAHSDADGQVVPLDSPFEVGGYPMMHPGDRSAPAHLTVNCRCVMTGVEGEPDFASEPALYTDEADNAEWLNDEWERLGEAEGEVYGSGNATARAFEAFGRYQDRDHRIVNQALRKGDLGPSAEKIVEGVDRLFDTHGVRADRAVQAYRGGASPMLRGAKVGDVVSDPAYMSTSVNHADAKAFGKVVEVEVPEGTTFLPGHASEGEMVFRRGSRVEVLSVDPPRVRIVV